MSQYVYDATNVRLAELSIGYDFPVAKWGASWLKGLNLSIVGNNLAMLYLKAPFDPEMTASVGTYNQGVDYFMQPSTRSVGFSIKAKIGGETASKAPVHSDYNTPYVPAKTETQVVEKIVEKEVIKEVPVEVVKEVIKEVRTGATLESSYTDNLFFVLGKAEILPEEAFKLGRICQILKDNPDAKITITGYADSATGNSQINSELAKERAESVTNMLKSAGINASRISFSSVGGDFDASKSPESNRVAVCIVK